MKHKCKLISRLAVASILFLAFALAVNATGLGVAPNELKFENILKGTSAEKQFTISNVGENEIMCIITAEGELSKWLELPANITIPANSNKKITAKLTPPKNQADGKYNATIHIKAESSSVVQGTGMGILPAVGMKAFATITDKKIIDGEVYKILTRDVEYGNPVTFIIGFTNKGNIKLAPDIGVEITKREVIDTIKETPEKIKPGMNNDYEIKWQTQGQASGDYQAKVSVKLDNELLEEKTVRFKVTGKGAEITKASAPQGRAVAPIGTSTIIGIIIVLAVVLGGLVIYYVFIRD